MPAPSTLFTPCESMIFPVDDEALLSKPKELTDLNDQAVIALAEKHKYESNNCTVHIYSLLL